MVKWFWFDLTGLNPSSLSPVGKITMIFLNRAPNFELFSLFRLIFLDGPNGYNKTKYCVSLQYDTQYKVFLKEITSWLSSFERWNACVLSAFQLFLWSD